MPFARPRSILTDRRDGRQSCATRTVGLDTALGCWGIIGSVRLHGGQARPHGSWNIPWLVSRLDTQVAEATNRMMGCYRQRGISQRRVPMRIGRPSRP